MLFRLMPAAVTFAVALGAAPYAAADISPDLAAMPAGTYAMDARHAFIVGKVVHFGLSNYTFRFDKFDIAYTFDPAAPDAAKITVSIDVNSLNTGYDKADKEFAADFLGGGKSPTATFVSTSITHTGNKGVVTGDFTLNGVTKPVALDVTFNGYGPIGPMGMLGTKAGFTATGTVKRSAFGLTKYVPAVGDDVTIEVNAEFSVKK